MDVRRPSRITLRRGPAGWRIEAIAAGG
jgi:hypothetical protein